ncbi:30S ribosomal protein S2 [Candidatus Acetothermia bacterium]|nr:30S ribosomal protein S2 [Candidatus Acetothermia bacterium]MBI3643735.1 30S ribosomal protein S2 [Candidatus Acetothermia bacterium]
MGVLSMKELLETGVHFGHRVRKWNPKMREYIYMERKGVHIINLEKTIKLFEEAYFFIRDSVSAGKEMLFVGTKRQVQKTIEEEALRGGAHFVNQRWLGGTLTNFSVIKSRIQRMIELEEHERAGDFERLPNKEAQRLGKELQKLKRNLEGLRNMKRVPDMVFVIDTQVELNAIREAKLMKIPVIAVIDTNCDPDMIDFPIPGNDDAIKATKLIISRIADAVAEGNKGKNFAGSTRAPDEAIPDATMMVAEVAEKVAQVAAKEFEEVAVDLEEAFAEKESAFDSFEAAAEPGGKDESE